MANALSLVAVLLCVASYGALSSARTFTVGDDQGWMSGIDYTDWTSGKTFAVGDKLLFSYRSQEHTVTEVSKSGYYTCSGSGALSDDTSGWTVVTLTGPGTRYFICNVTGLCSSGMKLAVTVAESGGGTVPSGASGGAPTPGVGSAVVVVATGVLIKLALF
ncbi:hypothetical protein SETIT_2G237700v2 [Setaria italica]|uniref:Phytocyanin domain-containing protein n=1 Tax=Setaria italica TaxID=4555 RepID=K3ZXL5_SETIT|nr:blue copper protein [Setaria italica]RCV12056.1 hypothetical protein SETIT_2G237700v2 [Setaria italica]